MDADFVADALDLLHADVEAGRLRRHAVRDEHVRAAAYLPGRLHSVPLRTLDALHLAVCEGRGIDGLATADRRMSRAARALGMTVVEF